MSADEPLGALGGRLVRLQIPSALSPTEGVAAARGVVPDAVWELNHLYRASAACAGDACWPVAATQADRAAGCPVDAAIAMIDTGVDRRHPLLRRARVEARDFLPDGAAAADVEHGTAVAALLVGAGADAGARLQPIAPGARLLAASAFRRLGDQDLADAGSVVRALDWAMSRRPAVVLMSLEGPPNATLEIAVRLASQRALVVAAAGNGGGGAPPAPTPADPPPQAQ